jgi:hypothetical protein
MLLGRAPAHLIKKFFLIAISRMPARLIIIFFGMLLGGHESFFYVIYIKKTFLKCCSVCACSPSI